MKPIRLRLKIRLVYRTMTQTPNANTRQIPTLGRRPKSGPIRSHPIMRQQNNLTPRLQINPLLNTLDGSSRILRHLKHVIKRRVSTSVTLKHVRNNDRIEDERKLGPHAKLSIPHSANNPSNSPLPYLIRDTRRRLRQLNSQGPRNSVSSRRQRSIHTRLAHRHLILNSLT